MKSEFFRSSEFFKQIVEGADVAACVADLDGIIVYANNKTAKLIGYTLEEIIGFSADLFLTKKGIELFHKGLKERQSGVTAQYETWCKTKDGREVDILLAASPVKNENGRVVASLAMMTDLTEKNKIIEELKRIEIRLNEAQQLANMGSWDLILATEEVFWSPETFRIMGLDPKTTKPSIQAYRERVHPEDQHLIINATTVAKTTGKSYDLMFRIIRPDGEIRNLRAIGKAGRNEKGDIVRLAGTVQDLTDQIRQEEKMMEQEAKSIASAKLAAIGMMAAGIAHEINNPLSIIKMLNDSMRARIEAGVPDPEACLRGSEKIEQMIERTSRIIRSLYRLAHQDDGEKFESMPVSQILEDTVTLCQSRFTKNKIELQSPSVDPGLNVECRKGQIEQILLNLLNNAFDAATDSNDKWVRLNILDLGNEIEFSVSDSGKGISQDDHEKIFQPFFTTKPVGSGVGLGLSLSAAIAQQHHGSLSLDIESPNTRFVLRLPKRQS